MDSTIDTRKKAMNQIQIEYAFEMCENAYKIRMCFKWSIERDRIDKFASINKILQHRKQTEKFFGLSCSRRCSDSLRSLARIYGKHTASIASNKFVSIKIHCVGISDGAYNIE